MIPMGAETPLCEEAEMTTGYHYFIPAAVILSIRPSDSAEIPGDHKDPADCAGRPDLKALKTRAKASVIPDGSEDF